MSENKNPQDVQPANQPADELSEEQLDNVAGGATPQLDLSTSQDSQEIGLLLPAVQAAREAARRSK